MSERKYGWDPRGCFAAGEEHGRMIRSALKSEGLLETIQPVVFRRDGNISVSYVSNGNPAGIFEEDWTLLISATIGPDRTYDVSVRWKTVANVPTRDGAIAEMG